MRNSGTSSLPTITTGTGEPRPARSGFRAFSPHRRNHNRRLHQRPRGIAQRHPVGRVIDVQLQPHRVQNLHPKLETPNCSTGLLVGQTHKTSTARNRSHRSQAAKYSRCRAQVGTCARNSPRTVHKLAAKNGVPKACDPILSSLRRASVNIQGRKETGAFDRSRGGIRPAWQWPTTRKVWDAPWRPELQTMPRGVSRRNISSLSVLVSRVEVSHRRSRRLQQRGETRITDRPHGV